MPEDFFLELDNVSWQVDGREILRNISLKIPCGHTITFIGKNNSGKSTILKLCAGLIQPTEGIIKINGVPLRDFSYGQLQNFLSSSGTVFQGGVLVNNSTVFENIALPLRYHNKFPEKEIRSRVEEQIKLLQLESYIDHFPAILPNEVKIRTNFARAFVVNPKTLFLDEPFYLMEMETVKIILNTIKKLKQENKTVILVAMNITNFMAMTYERELCDEVAVMENGAVKEVGRPQDIRNKLIPSDFSFDI